MIEKAERQRVSTGSKWEPIVGYSRAVRAGRHVFVTGTVAVDESGAVVGPGDMYVQARYALKRIERALGEIGARPADVVRTRIFVTDIARWEEVGKAHAEVFGDIRPATTMVQVCALIDPAYLVEIEADAVIDD